MRKLIALLSLAFSMTSGQALTLPDEIIALVEKQGSEFRRVLEISSSKQRQLVLERYVDLLLRSPFTTLLKLDKEELLQYISTRFLHGLHEEEEAPQKKGRRQPVYAEAVEKELEKIGKAFQGRFHGGLLELNFSCDNEKYELPFQIMEVEKDYKLILSGVAIPKAGGILSDDSRCLELTMQPGNQTGTLSWLGTLGAACPIPLKGAAKCLIDVAEKIAKTAGRKRLILNDGSYIYCPVNRMATSLRKLKIYQEGRSWYEKYKYLPMRDASDYQTEMAEFHYYLLSRLLDDVDKLKPNRSTQHVIQLLQEETREYLGLHEGRTVSQFMSWLWKKDCTKYMDLDRFITNRYWGLDFARRYPTSTLFFKNL